MSYKYKHSILGGTFDHFHKGHKHFLDEAFKNSEKVTIGLTTPSLFKNKLLSSEIEDYKTREMNIKNYLKTKGYLKRTTLIVLDNIYGNSLSEKNIESIFVTSVGIKNAKIINKKREEVKFRLLKIINVPFCKGMDKKIISSTRVRTGEIDRDGNAYKSIFKTTKELTLTEDLREDLKKPLGKIISNSEDLSFLNKKNIIISIGDMVTSSLIQKGVIPTISVFDLKTKRQKINKKITDSLPVPNKTFINKPGFINSRAAVFIQTAIKNYILKGNKSAIKIIGEEDLLTLPAILFAPLNSIVIYGVPNKGICVVNVTEKNKKEIQKKYLDRFDISGI